MRILCATDLLPRNEAAIERAALLANQLAAELALLHVMSAGEAPQVSQETLRAQRAKARADSLLWRTHGAADLEVRVGDPARLIIDTVARRKARLLVLGPHRRRQVRDALGGTIAQKVLAKRSVPVLIVRDDVRGAYRHVLLALDLSEASVSAIRAAESLVLTPEAAATVVHAHEPPYQGMLQYADIGMESSYMQNWRRGANDAIRELLQYESANSARYDIYVEQQPAAAAVQMAIDRYAPDLVVMGTHGGGRLRRALRGSVANRIVHEANCDVLMVPEGCFGASRSKLVFGGRRAHDSGNPPAQSP